MYENLNKTYRYIHSTGSTTAATFDSCQVEYGFFMCIRYFLECFVNSTHTYLFVEHSTMSVSYTPS